MPLQRIFVVVFGLVFCAWASALSDNADLHESTRYAALLQKYNAGDHSLPLLRYLSQLALRQKDYDHSTAFLNEYIGRSVEPYSSDTWKFIQAVTRTSRDKGFEFLRSHVKEADAALGEGAVIDKIQLIARQEELEDTLVCDNKPLESNPDWSALQSAITTKYPEVDAHRMILDYAIGYYRGRGINWSRWADFMDARIKDYPPAPGLHTYMELNSFGAWDAFLNCPDKAVLERTLGWIDLAIRLDAQDPNSEMDEYLDTKANVLYKLGRTSEALALEARAASLTKDPEVRHTYEKMTRGQPTWPQPSSGAR